MLLGGLVYSVMQQYMPYHSEAIETPWAELAPLLRTFILTSLNAGGGLMACNAAGLTILLVIPFRQGHLWATWSIVIIGSLSMLIVLKAAITINLHTPANPPWQLLCALMPLLWIAHYFQIKTTKQINK